LKHLNNDWIDQVGSDSEWFYNSVFYLLNDAEEQVGVNLLLSW